MAFLDIPTADGESANRFQAVVSKFEVQSIHGFKELMELQWAKAWTQLPTFAQNSEEESKQCWLTASLPNLLQECVSARHTALHNSARDKRPRSPSKTRVSTTEPLRSEVDMFASPKQRRRQTETLTPKTLTVAEAHGQDTSNASAFVLRAYLLFLPEAVRWVRTQNRASKEAEETAVITAMLADHSGPILFEAWRSVAETFLKLAQPWLEASSSPPLIEITLFTIKTMSRRDNPCFPQNMKKLTAVENASIRLCPEGTSLSSSDSLDDSFYIKDFSTLTGSPPFTINIAGVVSAVQNETEAKDGTSMGGFRLHDYTGRFIMCIIDGRHVVNDNIHEGNEVVSVYAGTCRFGRRMRIIVASQ